jgi:hypothetical protein
MKAKEAELNRREHDIQQEFVQEVEKSKQGHFKCSYPLLTKSFFFFSRIATEEKPAQTARGLANEVAKPGL